MGDEMGSRELYVHATAALNAERKAFRWETIEPFLQEQARMRKLPN
jgi:hypothetical protein